MKLKERLAQAYIKSNEVNCGCPDCSERFFIAGFQAHKNMTLEFLKDISYLPDDEESTVTEGRDIIKRVQELGEQDEP